MATGIPSPGLETVGGPNGGTVLLWLEFLLPESYNGPPEKLEARGRGVVGVEDCTTSCWMLCGWLEQRPGGELQLTRSSGRFLLAELRALAWLALGEVGLRFAAFDFCRIKINASIN